MKYFLGFEIAKTKNGISLYQRKYALNLLQDNGSTPMDPQLKLHKQYGNSLSDPTSFKLIGRLLYLAHTLPDITYAVNILSQYLDSPTDLHYQVLLLLRNSFLGRVRSNSWCLGPHLKINVEHLHRYVVKLNGYSFCYMTSSFPILHSLFF